MLRVISGIICGSGKLPDINFAGSARWSVHRRFRLFRKESRNWSRRWSARRNQKFGWYTW